MAESSSSLRPHRSSSKQSGAINGSRSRLNSQDGAKQRNITELVQKLCFNINGKRNDERMRSMYRKAVEFLNSGPISEPSATRDERHHCDRIRRHLEQNGGEEAGVAFDNSIRRLREQGIHPGMNAILHLLDSLRGSGVPDPAGDVKQPAAFFDPPRGHPSSPPFEQGPLVELGGPPADRRPTENARAGKKVKTVPAHRQTLPPGLMSLPMLVVNGGGSAGGYAGDSSRQAVSLGDQRGSASGRPAASSSGTSTAASGVALPRSRRIRDQPVVTEAMLVRDLLYAFQGVNGRVIKFDPIVDGYNIDAKMNVARRLRNMALKLAELGWLHNELRQFCANWSHAKSVGVVGQSLTSAMRDQLTEYYRLLAHLQSQLQSCPSGALSSQPSEESLNSCATTATDGVTLRGLAVWAAEPHQRLLWLVTVAHACQSARGGAIASAAYGFLQHGDPAVRELVTLVLSAVCKPILRMLSRWVLDGELDDPNGEFFIAGNSEITGDRLWHEKYRVQESMVPSFISMAQAQKILATGKSINFLREVCRDHQELMGREQLRLALESTTVEALFKCDSDLTSILDTAYLQTSKRVIDVLIAQHKFLDHLQALRNFLLLGQGDFIRYLMELIEPELRKPGSELYPHNLSGILETAVRATNAQFEPPDVLNRLDVRVLDRTPGDQGWDIFTLDYHVTGPVGTVFAPTMTSYMILFQTLWKAKRIEWILSLMWKKQVTASKMLRNIPELGPVLQQINLIVSEMVHLVHQMQYYVLFEVVEISWEELRREVLAAESLDDIIGAHNHFLAKIKKGAMLDHKGLELSVQLRAMFETVLQLKTLVDRLHESVRLELDARNEMSAMIEELGRLGQFGITADQQDVYDEARHIFVHKTLPNYRHNIKTFTASYQTCVRKLLLMMSENECHSLQLLSFRLDFNGHYKSIDPRLSASLTYQHRRLSELGLQRRDK